MRQQIKPAYWNRMTLHGLLTSAGFRYVMTVCDDGGCDDGGSALDVSGVVNLAAASSL